MDHHKTAMDMLEHQIKQDCALIIPNDDDNTGERSSDVRNDDDGDEEEEEVHEMEELRRKCAKESTATTTDEASWGPVYRQIHSFFISRLMKGVACQWKLAIWWG
jgi:hypothetical protein